MATDLTPSVPITSIPPHSDDTPTSTIPTAITTKPVGFLAYTNGSTPIKRHTTTHLTPKHEPPPPRTMISTTTTTVSYKECMRNHAATIGGHALDGCCEFMPSPESNPAEPTSLVCAACGCHRNFHRRDPDDPTPLHQKHHPHPHPPPSHPHLNPRTPPPESPLPPPTSTFYSSAPHFHHHLTPLQNNNNNLPTAPSPVAMASAPPNGTRKLKLPLISDRGSGGDGSGRISRKRFRTKFTREQKERMQGFAERMGWKMQKIDRRVVEEFCEEIGVGREVLKVWMHNNKNVFVRNRDEISGHSHGLHNGSNHNNRQVTGGTTSTTAVVGGGGDKIIGNGGGDRIIHGLFYSTSSSNGGDADGGGGAGVKVERMDMTVGRGGDDDDGSGSGSGGSHRSNGVDRFEHFQVVSADGSASSSSSG